MDKYSPCIPVPAQVEGAAAVPLVPLQERRSRPLPRPDFPGFAAAFFDVKKDALIWECAKTNKEAGGDVGVRRIGGRGNEKVHRNAGKRGVVLDAR